jgi:hypothetical protein
MVLSPFNTTAWQRLLSAEAAGHLRLVDEYAQPVEVADALALNQHCWAHLRDAVDGQIYVHELSGGCELLEVRYLDMLVANV